jgi:hypothetical protein
MLFINKIISSRKKTLSLRIFISNTLAFNLENGNALKNIEELRKASDSGGYVKLTPKGFIVEGEGGCQNFV